MRGTKENSSHYTHLVIELASARVKQLKEQGYLATVAESYLEQEIKEEACVKYWDSDTIEEYVFDRVADELFKLDTIDLLARTVRAYRNNYISKKAIEYIRFN